MWTETEGVIGWSERTPEVNGPRGGQQWHREQ